MEKEIRLSESIVYPLIFSVIYTTGWVIGLAPFMSPVPTKIDFVSGSCLGLALLMTLAFVWHEQPVAKPQAKLRDRSAFH